MQKNNYLIILILSLLLINLLSAQTVWNSTNNCNLTLTNNSVIDIIVDEDIVNTDPEPCVVLTGIVYNVSLKINLNNKTITKTNDFMLLDNIANSQSEFCSTGRNISIIIANGTINASNAIIRQGQNATTSQIVSINNITTYSKYFYHGGNGTCAFTSSSFIRYSRINAIYLFNLSKRGCLYNPYFEYNNISVNYLITTYNASTPFNDANFDKLCPSAILRYNNITTYENRWVDILVLFGSSPNTDERLSLIGNTITFTKKELEKTYWNNGSVVTALSYFFSSAGDNIIRQVEDLTPTPSTTFKTLPSTMGDMSLYFPRTDEQCIASYCPSGFTGMENLNSPVFGKYWRSSSGSNPSVCADAYVANGLFGTTTPSNAYNLYCKVSNSNKNITFQIFSDVGCYNTVYGNYYGIIIIMFVPDAQNRTKPLYKRTLEYFPFFIENNESYLYCNYINISTNQTKNNTPFISQINIKGTDVAKGGGALIFQAPNHNITITPVSFPKHMGFQVNNNVYEQIHPSWTTTSPAIITPSLASFLGYLITSTKNGNLYVLNYVPFGGFGHYATYGSYWESNAFIFFEDSIQPYYKTTNTPYYYNLPVPPQNSYLYRFTIKNAKTLNIVPDARVEVSLNPPTLFSTMLFTQIDGSASIFLRLGDIYNFNITKDGYKPLFISYIPSLQQEITLYLQPIQEDSGSTSYETLIREILANTNYVTEFNKTSRVYKFNWNTTDQRVQYGETRCYNTTGNYYILYAHGFGNGSNNFTSITLPANSSYVCENILFVGYGMVVIKESILEAHSWAESIKDIALFMAVVIVLTIAGAFAYSPIMSIIAATFTVLLLGFTGIIYLPPLAYAGLVIVTAIVVLIIIKKSYYYM